MFPGNVGGANWGSGAYDSARGLLLPFSAHSVPGTYVWQGKRYVVVSAGGHGKVDGSKLGGAMIAFAVE